MTIGVKILVLSFPIIIYILLRLIFRILKIKKNGSLRVIDIWTLFLIWGLDTFTQQNTQLSILPYYILLISGIGLLYLLLDLLYFKRFTFSSFFKRFWRTTYLVTSTMYLCLIIAVFFLS